MYIHQTFNHALNINNNISIYQAVITLAKTRHTRVHGDVTLPSLCALSFCRRVPIQRGFPDPSPCPFCRREYGGRILVAPTIWIVIITRRRMIIIMILIMIMILIIIIIIIIIIIAISQYKQLHFTYLVMYASAQRVKMNI